jgi:hypothetical protein
MWGGVSGLTDRGIESNGERRERSGGEGLRMAL